MTTPKSASKTIRQSVQIKSLVREGMLIYNDGYRTKASELNSCGLPILRVSQINEGRIVGEPTDFIDPVYDQKIGAKKSQIGDVVLTTKGTIGRIARIKDKTEVGYAYSPQVIWSRATQSTLSKFLFYALQSRQVQNQLRVLSEQTDMAPYVNLHDYGLVEIPFPTEQEQEAIAEVLSSLDDKIDLLKWQNKTLEGLAEALFRQWFIEEAQDDWEEVEMGELIEIRNGKDHKHLGEGNIPVYGSGGLMRKADGFLFEGESVLLPRKGTLNNVMIVNEAFWTVDTMFYTEMKRPNLMKFVFHHLKRLDLASMNVGSAVPSMTKTAYNHITVLMPTESKLEAFEMEVSRLFERVKSNHDKIQNLKAQRDTLLPKLMSGEVRVKMD